MPLLNHHLLSPRQYTIVFQDSVLLFCNLILRSLHIYMQFSGINGVLYYTPQILEQAGVGVLLSNMGISSASASLLISAITTLLMLPCIAVAMRLMDISGRRYLTFVFAFKIFSRQPFSIPEDILKIIAYYLCVLVLS